MIPTRPPPPQQIILPGTTIGGEVGIFRADFTIRHKDGTQLRALNGVGRHRLLIRYRPGAYPG